MLGQIVSHVVHVHYEESALHRRPPGDRDQSSSPSPESISGIPRAEVLTPKSFRNPECGDATKAFGVRESVKKVADGKRNERAAGVGVLGTANAESTRRSRAQFHSFPILRIFASVGPFESSVGQSGESAPGAFKVFQSRGILTL
jgi:hypothetical protein